MPPRSRIFVIMIVLFAFLAVSVSAYLIFRRSSISSNSLLLYTNYQSPETITNWIMDTESGERWEVGKGLAAGGWSPSGKYVDFHTLSPLPIEIWVGNQAGSNMRRVFDGRNYPDLKVTGYDWLTDESIIVNVEKDFHVYAYLLNINTLAFERIPNSTGFAYLSPNGQFWVEFDLQDKYSLFSVDGKRKPLTLRYWYHYFSPSGDQVAYSCAGTYKFSSLCLAEISMAGITNESKIAEDILTNAFGDSWWSQDGKFVGFLYSPDGKNEIWFRAVDVSNGETACDWAYPTKTTRVFWSPRGDKIVDFDGLLLDLKTGQISDFFQNEPIPSYVVDWRLIETQ
jgi:hypothetical protein